MRLFAVLLVAAALTACGSSRAIAPGDSRDSRITSTRDYALVSVSLAGVSHAATGGLTLRPDSSYRWTMGDTVKAGHWRGEPSEMVFTDTVPSGYIGVWFGTLDGASLTLNTLSGGLAYQFAQR